MYSYNDIECPYCGYEFDLNHDDGAYYSEDRAEECECPDCDKKFLVSSSMSWSHEGIAAECLNDESKHEWRKRYPKSLIERRPELESEEQCYVCNETRTVKAND